MGSDKPAIQLGGGGGGGGEEVDPAPGLLFEREAGRHGFVWRQVIAWPGSRRATGRRIWICLGFSPVVGIES